MDTHATHAIHVHPMPEARPVLAGVPAMAGSR